jgi:hypothetical protein
MGYGETAEYGTLDYKQDEETIDEVGRHFRAMVQIWPVEELLRAEDE